MPASQDGRSVSSSAPDSTHSTLSRDGSSANNSATHRFAEAAQEAARRHGFMDNDTKIFVKRYRTELSAMTASLCSTLSAYPLDSMKTRMQAYKFRNLAECIRHTYRTEGFHGFWRGALAPLASITLVRTVSFSIYQRAKYQYDDWIYSAFQVSPLQHANTVGAYPSLATVSCFGAAGATSGALITFIACPFELTKLSAQIAVLMQRGGDAESDVQNGKGEQRNATPRQASSNPMLHKKSMGAFGTARHIVQQRGLLGLYSGFHLHLIRDTLGTAFYFMTYESTKQLMANARGNSPTNPLAVVLAGGICGLVSWAFIYPIDSAKSMYQRNVLTTASHSVPQKVPIQFYNARMYRGLGVSMFRSCCINAIFFSVFELMKKRINRIEVDEDDD